MNKRINLILLGLVLVLNGATPIYGKETIELHIGGNPVPTESYTYTGRIGQVEGKYYMDVLPQVKNDRTYVPLSTITNFLGATVSWQNPNIAINYKDQALNIAVGETKGNQNGQEIQLDTPPYIDKGRTMVPLRFISEAFGLGVEYKDNKVSIDLPRLKIKGEGIYAVQSEYWMTMGSVISENKNNSYISRMYDVISKAKTKEVEEPALFGNNHNIDVPEFYDLLGNYYFIDSNKKAVETYEIYYELSFGMRTGVYLIRDVKHSKWYNLSEEVYEHIIDLGHIGKWDEVSNTVV